MENNYSSNTTCKASWKIIKILKYEDKCANYYRFKFNDWVKDFIMSWTEPKLESSSTWCIYKTYTFSWWEVPKVWDNINVIGIHESSIILKIGEEYYNSNINLPDCEIQYDWDPSYENYLWTDKCKVSWKIEAVKRVFVDRCWLNLWIKVKNGENIYLVWWREYFTWKSISLCLWIWEWWQPIDSTDWKITTQINIWNNFYAVLNKKDNTILRYWKDEYNANFSIPFCSGATEIQSFTWWITENYLKKIMNAVERQIIHDFPDLKNKQGTINSIPTWISTTTNWETTISKIKKNEEKKIVYVKPKINAVNVYSSMNPIQKINIESETLNTNLKNIVNSSSWLIEKQEMNTWNIIQIVEENDEFKTEKKMIEREKQEINWNTNYFWIIWIIIIWIILSIIFTFVYRKIKK